MQQCNKNIENGVKNIQSVNQSLVLLMPRPSAPSALCFCTMLSNVIFSRTDRSSCQLCADICTSLLSISNFDASVYILCFCASFKPCNEMLFFITPYHKLIEQNRTKYYL